MRDADPVEQPDRDETQLLRLDTAHLDTMVEVCGISYGGEYPDFASSSLLRL